MLEHMPLLLTLVRRYWNGDASSERLQLCCIALLEEMCNVQPDEFRYYLPELLPMLLAVFKAGREHLLLICLPTCVNR